MSGAALHVDVDMDAFWRIVRDLLAVDPELAANVDKLFLREASPYEASALFDYLFVVASGPALEAEHFVGWRLRSPEERDLALGALKLKSGYVHHDPLPKGAS